MNNKKAGRLTGIAFIIGTAAGVACLTFVNVIQEANYLNSIASNPKALTFGALLIVLMGIACSLIAYAIYPVLSKYNKTLAIGAVGFRTIEGALMLLSAITLLSLVPIATEYTASGSDAVMVAGNTVLGLHNTLGGVMGIAFAVGAMMYNIGFYITKLVPRWLSIWGMIALVMYIVASILLYYGIDGFSPINVILNMPIALQEMVMAVYLIVFGFREVKATA